MKLLLLHGDPSLASARVRVLDLVPHLRARGVDCETALLPSRPWELRRRLAASDADVVVIQKKTPSPLAGLAWRACRAPLVFDYDDAILFRRAPRGGSFESRTRRRRFARAVRIADAFACGNEYLAALCRGAKPVLVVPSAVPLDVPRASERRRVGPARVGWIGAPHNLAELESIAPALRGLARRHDFVLAVISEAAPRIDGVPVEHVPWKLSSQAQEIARLDVGLMPLADTPWTRGKCAYKLLQYMAGEVPAVASPVGMNREVIVHARNGLLADGPDAWQAAIGALLDDEAVARRLAAAGRRTVEERFGYPGVAARWHAFLGGLTRS